MNERIRNLYIQAINDTKHHPADNINTQIAEKFAELIVQECLVVVNQPNGVGDDDVIRISEDVKKHFGVEE